MRNTTATQEKMIMGNFDTPAPNFTQAEWDAMPLWERELCTPTTAEGVAVIVHKISEWAIFDNSDAGSKIIYRWPADRNGQRKVEREYDRQGYPLDPSKCFAKITYWSDEPQAWEIEGSTYF